MNNFEENLQKLENLSSDIKRSDISLEEALKDFEEGIKLAKGMEKELEQIEAKIQILMKNPDELTEEEKSSARKKSPKAKETDAALDLFAPEETINGTRSV